MKVIKNIIFVAIVFLISIGLLVVGNGYDMYKDAISKIPLTEKVETIKEKENYTKIDSGNMITCFRYLHRSMTSLKRFAKRSAWVKRLPLKK